MKISFSTLACPEYSWSDIYSMAKDIGFNGIEIRGLGNDIFAVFVNMVFVARDKDIHSPFSRYKVLELAVFAFSLFFGIVLVADAVVKIEYAMA